MAAAIGSARVDALGGLLLRLCLCLPALALAQQEMEIIALRYRTLDQVLPTLQPLLEPGATLSGMNDQLILRASPRNRQQIKQALAAIDTPPRRLLIRVSQNREVEGRDEGVAVVAGGDIGQTRWIGKPSGGMQESKESTRVEVRRGDAGVSAQAWDSRRTRTSGSTQTVQVVDGGRALIEVGRSLPIPLRQVAIGPRGLAVSEGIVYRDVGQGFYAAPRVVGERVTVDISPRFDSPGESAYGTIGTQRLTSTVSGRLGEWLELGGSSQQAVAAGSGQGRSGNSQSLDQRSVWLQVEELP